MFTHAVRRALDIEPRNGFYLDMLGWIQYKRGDYPEAVKHLEQAVELTDNNPTIADGDAYEKVGRSANALRSYRTALAKATEPEPLVRLRDKVANLSKQEQTTQSVQEPVPTQSMGTRGGTIRN